MGVTLAKITSNTATVTFKWGEDDVNVVYYPAKVTEKTVAQLHSLATTNETDAVAGFEILNLVLAGLPSMPGSGLIKSWDVFEDEEQTVMFPVDAGRLSELPLMFRSQIIQAIMGDIRPETLAPQA